MAYQPLDPATTETEVRKALLSTLLKANAFDASNHFLNIDRVWTAPQFLRLLAEQLAQYMRLVLPVREAKGIVSIDNVLHPYGPVPIAAELAIQLDLPLGIWKENADPLTGAYRLYGNIPVEDLIVLYDVTRFGLTAFKVLSALAANRKQPRWLVTIVDCEMGAEDLLRSQAAAQLQMKVDVLHILKLSEFVHRSF